MWKKKFAFALFLISSLWTPATSSGVPLSGVLNLNTASYEQLQRLPGIGPSKAAKILAARRHRPFQSFAQIRSISGIGPKRLKALRPFVRFSGPNTLEKRLLPETSPKLPPCLTPLLTIPPENLKSITPGQVP